MDGRATSKITAYLFHAGGSDDPVCLQANAGKSYAGSFILGMGFTFDDTDKKGVTSSISEMNRLIDKDHRNAERIFPYLGGEEINTNPTHSYHRFVINFADMTEEEARRWPDLIEVLERKVKPERAKLHGNPDADKRREKWWLWGRYTPALYDAISHSNQVLAHSRISTWLSFVLLKTGPVFDITVNVFPLQNPMRAFPVLQSRPHEVWARFMASSMKDDIRYTPSDCFETFPFPFGYESNDVLEAAGRDYYDFRAGLMVRNNEGLTKTYNRFHDPNETSSDIRRLRELHDAMDRAVLDAYGWRDIQRVCDFFPQFDDEDEEDENGRPKRKKYRYRWPEAIHDEVLTRLLELNRQRALEEGQLSAAPVPATATSGKPKGPSKKSASKKPKDNSAQPMLELGAGEA